MIFKQQYAFNNKWAGWGVGVSVFKKDTCPLVLPILSSYIKIS